MYDALMKAFKAMMPLMACGAIGGLICLRNHYLLGWAIGWMVSTFFYRDKWLKTMKTHLDMAMPINDTFLKELFKGKKKY